MYVVNQLTLLDQADADIAVGGPFNAPNVVLYTNDVYPARGMVLGDFDVADFAGLTNRKAVTLGAPFINDLQQAQVNGNLIAWLTISLVLLPITAFGYLMLNTAGSDWLLGERFAEPLTFSRIGQSEQLVPRLVWD